MFPSLVYEWPLLSINQEARALDYATLAPSEILSVPPVSRVFFLLKSGEASRQPPAVSFWLLHTLALPPR